MTDKYNEILYEEYSGSKNHRKMLNSARAAQFMPFAALTGYSEAIQDASITTDQKKDLTEQEKTKLDYKLQEMLKMNEKPVIKIKYFQKDEKKTGGIYITETLKIKKIDEIKRILYFENHACICLDDIIEIGD